MEAKDTEKPFTKAEKQFVRFLMRHHNDKDNPITSKQIEKKLNISSRAVRQLVNKLRSQSVAICSDCTGYFYSTNRDDILSSIEHLSGRTKHIENAMDGLLKGLEKLKPEFDNKYNKSCGITSSELKGSKI